MPFDLASPIPYQVAGLGAAGLILLSGLTTLAGSLRRARAGARRERLERELLAQRLAQARVALEEERRRMRGRWDGLRKFRVVRREPANASGTVCSFYLEPHDGRPIPSFRPGQFLTFQLQVPDQPRPVIRCYSISCGPLPELAHYRISVRRVDKGLVSRFLHDAVQPGWILDVRAPSGDFHADLSQDHPMVMLAGGVGITPLLSMLEAVVHQQPQRRVWFFHGAMSSQDVIAHQELVELTSRGEHVLTWYCLSHPSEADKLVAARQNPAARLRVVTRMITVDWLKEVLPPEAATAAHFYMCGPPPMMDAMMRGLEAWGITPDRIHSEAFGPASVARTTGRVAPLGNGAAVTFARSGKKANWDAGAGNLLAFAEAQGVAIDSGCRVGNCGTCRVAIKSGQVKYSSKPHYAVEAGSCLPCVGVPAGELTIDA